MTQQLPARLPDDYQLVTPANTWRYGWVLQWGLGFSPPQWIRKQTVSIRPNESAEDVYFREFGCPLPKNHFIVWYDW